jgi:hypothetical protein
VGEIAGKLAGSREKSQHSPSNDRILWKEASQYDKSRGSHSEQFILVDRSASGVFEGDR